MDSPEGARILSLFSGVGGLELGLRLAIPGSRVVACVEREAYACQVLVTRMEEGSLDPAPIWTDVTTFAGKPWRGAVDLICGGFPCQDISCAGKGAGLEGSRSGLWWEFHRIIGEVGPQFVFVENVSALLVRGLDTVLGSLAEIGFDAEWMCLRASDVGAPHRRERVFILAHRHDSGLSIKWGSGVRGAELSDANRCGGAEADVGDTAHDHRGSGERRAETGTRQDGERGRGSPVAGSTVENAEDVGSRAFRPDGGEPYRAEGAGGAIEQLPLFPPGPTDDWSGILERWPWLAPAVAHATNRKARQVGVTSRFGNAGGCPAKPAVRGMADGMAYRVDRLRACGNGVVATQAAAAFTELARRLK